MQQMRDVIQKHDVILGRHDERLKEQDTRLNTQNDLLESLTKAFNDFKLTVQKGFETVRTANHNDVAGLRTEQARHFKEIKQDMGGRPTWAVSLTITTLVGLVMALIVFLLTGQVL